MKHQSHERQNDVNHSNKKVGLGHLPNEKDIQVGIDMNLIDPRDSFDNVENHEGVSSRVFEEDNEVRNLDLHGSGNLKQKSKVKRNLNRSNGNSVQSNSSTKPPRKNGKKLSNNGKERKFVYSSIRTIEREDVERSRRNVKVSAEKKIKNSIDQSRPLHKKTSKDVQGKVAIKQNKNTKGTDYKNENILGGHDGEIKEKVHTKTPVTINKETQTESENITGSQNTEIHCVVGNSKSLLQKEILDHLTTITHLGERKMEVGGWPLSRRWKLKNCDILTPDTDTTSLYELKGDSELINQKVSQFYTNLKDESYDFIFMIDTIHFLSFEEIENLIRMSSKGVIYAYQPKYQYSSYKCSEYHHYQNKDEDYIVSKGNNIYVHDWKKVFKFYTDNMTHTHDFMNTTSTNITWTIVDSTNHFDIFAFMLIPKETNIVETKLSQYEQYAKYLNLLGFDLHQYQKDKRPVVYPHELVTDCASLLTHHTRDSSLLLSYTHDCRKKFKARGVLVDENDISKFVANTFYKNMKHEIENLKSAIHEDSYLPQNLWNSGLHKKLLLLNSNLILPSITTVTQYLLGFITIIALLVAFTHVSTSATTVHLLYLIMTLTYTLATISMVVFLLYLSIGYFNIDVNPVFNWITNRIIFCFPVTIIWTIRSGEKIS